MLACMNIYCYAIINTPLGEPLEFRVSAREALQSAREYKIYSAYKNVCVFRVPFLPSGRGDQSQFINLNDGCAGYVPKDIIATNSGCKYVPDKIYTLESTLEMRGAAVYFTNIVAARKARDTIYEKTRKHLDIYYADVLDVNAIDYDSRYLLQLRNIDGLDYYIVPVWNKVY